MYNFEKFSDNGKELMLKKLSGKTIRMLYNYPDTPDGSIGPRDLYGKILSISTPKFRFYFLKPEQEDSDLTIEGIRSITVLDS